MRTVFINLDARKFAAGSRYVTRYRTKEMERYKRNRIASILVTVSSVLCRTFVETSCVESIGKCFIDQRRGKVYY